jgi:hypothetical protein
VSVKNPYLISDNTGREMTHTREDVLALTIALYGKADLNEILSALDEYGTGSHEPEVSRVHLAILQLSESSKEKLVYFVKIAKIDYRDVLAWQKLKPLSPEEGAKWKTLAKSLIDRWGKK